MAWQLDDIASLPRPVLARRLAAQIGRNFSETISALIRLDDDVAAVVHHFHDGEADAARCRRRRAEPLAPAASLEGAASPTDGESSPRAMPEPIVICKSESEPIVVYTPCPPIAGGALYPPPPDNSAVIDELVSRGVLAPALLWTGRTVFASPGLARRLSVGGNRSASGLDRACGGPLSLLRFRSRLV